MKYYKTKFPVYYFLIEFQTQFPIPSIRISSLVHKLPNKNVFLFLVCSSPNGNGYDKDRFKVKIAGNKYILEVVNSWEERDRCYF